MFNTLLIQPLANGLILVYNLLGHNMGLAIIGYSLLLRVVLNPLTKPYMESMKKMRDFAPQLAKLKKKHGKDRVKLAQAQADFYKEKGVKPGGGCLPYILYILVTLAFFRLFIQTFVPGGDVAAKFNELLYTPLKLTSGINTNFLYLDLNTPDIFNVSGIPFALPGFFLVVSALLQFAASKIMAPTVKKQTTAAKATTDTADDMQAAMQSSMTTLFPIMTLLFGMRFPSSLAIYWALLSASQFAQQYKTHGLGGLAPLLRRLSLVKSSS